MDQSTTQPIPASRPSPLAPPLNRKYFFFLSFLSRKKNKKKEEGKTLTRPILYSQSWILDDTTKKCGTHTYIENKAVFVVLNSGTRIAYSLNVGKNNNIRTISKVAFPTTKKVKKEKKRK